MKRGWGGVFVLAVLCLIPVSGSAGEKVKFVVQVDPATFMVSPDADGFYVQSSGVREEIDGTTAWAPSIQAGIGFDAGEMMAIDAMVGAGWYYGGDVLESNFITERISARFKLGPFITLGPQVGLVQFDNLEWEGDIARSRITFSDSDGYLAGLAFTAGSERISFSLAVEYIDLDPFKVTTVSGWTAKSNELDLSGTLINLGVKFRF